MNNNPIIKKEFFPSGRVVDLKKLKEKEKIVEKRFDRNINLSEKRKGFFALLKKKKEIDFFKKYEKEEKLEDKIIFQNLSKENNSLKEKTALFLKIFWFFIFVARFIVFIFWRSFNIFVLRKRNWEEKIKIEIIKDEGAEEIKDKKFFVKDLKNVVAERKPAPTISLWFKIKNFWKDGSEDYLYQQALFQEITTKKFNPFRHAFAFIILAAILTLPLKVFSEYNLSSLDNLRGQVLGASEKAIDNLSQAADSVSRFDLNGASYDFFLAKDNFRQAQERIDEINGFLLSAVKLFPSEDLKLAGESKHIFAAGEKAANLGRNLSLAFNSFLNKDDKKISEMIDVFIEYESGALFDCQELNKEFSQINIKNLPLKYQEQFLLLKEKSLDLENILSEINTVAKKINIFLGKEVDKRYLLVFQNNDEARATGGFIGSFALLDLSRGQVKKIEVPEGGSYDTEAGMKDFIAAPEPLYLVNPLWHFWDANWWPDWEKSAKNLLWFYSKSDGPTVDGCISFTPTVLERMLQITGPIDMTETHGVIMTVDNAWENIRKIIEEEKVKSDLSYELAENKPKKIIGDLLERIMEELPKKLDKDSFFNLLNIISKSLDEKHILFYFTDESLQNEVEKRDWAGKIKETSRDYLSVVSTNIAGGKSDRKIREIITHQAEIMPDGSIIDNLTIERIHTGQDGEPFCGVRNVNWMRIYVPKGSELLFASGFRGPDPIYFSYPEESWEKNQELAKEDQGSFIDKNNNNTKIYIEDNKTVFANWSMVDPGQRAVVKLKYKLPFKLKKEDVVEEGWFEEIVNKFFKAKKKDLYAYSLLVQKQLGSRFTTIQTSLNFSNSFKVLWKYPKELKNIDRGWDFREELDVDKYWALILEKSEE